MALRQDKESALHYFDFRTENDGISTSDLGLTPHLYFLVQFDLLIINTYFYGLGKPWNLGFTFHAWICLDSKAPILRHGNLVRRQLYR